MTTNNECPCEECICMAMCRLKYFIDMKNDCCLIEQYLFEGMVFDRRRPDFDIRIYAVSQAIKPVLWKKDCIIQTVIDEGGLNGMSM